MVPEKISLNTALRKHNAALSAAKQEWYYTVIAERIKAYKGPFPVDIRYHYRLAGKAMDSTNTAFMSKALEDAMVQAGILPDDTPSFVRWSCFRSNKVNAGDPDTVQVSITPIDTESE